MAHENYSRVRLISDQYRDQGAAKGSIGYIIEVYPDGNYEIEFSGQNGVSIAQIVAAENDLELLPESVGNDK